MNNIIIKNKGGRSFPSIAFAFPRLKAGREETVRRARGRLSRTVIAAVGLVSLIAFVGCDAGTTVVTDDGRLTHVDSVDDSENAAYELDGADSVTTATIGSNTYLFAAGKADDGVSIFQVAHDGTLTYVDSIDDSENDAYELDGADSVTTALIGSNTYLFAAGAWDDGVSVFRVAHTSTTPLTLTHVDSVDDFEDDAYKLFGAISVTTASIGNDTYLFAAGDVDSGVSVFRVAHNGELTHVDSVDYSENIAYKLFGARSVTTAAIAPTTATATTTPIATTTPTESNTYLFAAGQVDSGVSVFQVAHDGTLTYVDSVDDSENDAYEIFGAAEVTTALIGSNTYLFVAGFEDNGVSVFRVAYDGTLTHVDSVDDSENTAYELKFARSVTTASIGSDTYLFVAGSVDSGVSVFQVAHDGTLTHVDSVDDSENTAYKLFGARSVTTALIGSNIYLFAAGILDDGVSVFSFR